MLARPSAADVVVTQLLQPGAAPAIEGPASLARTPYSPASTFKMIIALAAFEKGTASPDTRELCHDKHLPLRPMRLNFQQAMLYSSNDFFTKLREQVSDEEIQNVAKRCGFGEITGEWPADKGDLRLYSKIKITPLEMTAFLRKLAFGELPVKAQAQKDLVRVMSWPSEVDGVTAYAKTGSWDRTYWMVGLAVYPTTDAPVFEVIVVNLTKSGSNRDKAVKRFWQIVRRGMDQHGAKGAGS